MVIVLAVIAVPAVRAQTATCPATVFGGARTLLSRVPADERDVTSVATPPSERWVAFDRATMAILGADSAGGDPRARRAFIAALETEPPPDVACGRDMVERDRLAYALALVGYGAQDIASMLLREATRAEIDGAYARKMAGYPAPAPPPQASRAIAPPLTGLVATAARKMFRPDAQPAWPAPVRPALRPLVPAVLPQTDVDALDAYIRHYARSHQIDPLLVKAIIRQESNWDADGVSPKGAVGLMQLMPATAQMLRVNPRDPIDNIRGGIAYLAELLRNYGNVRHALIAYNAGPTHANQVIRGERTLYEETRRYLQGIAAMYPLNGAGGQ